ncbi:MAG: Lrp/AsnC family transcriptional regulator [Candidatus Hodarchaeales archaeon]|jgi:DNA-binding Lrp family transcriptional regulator
MGRKRVIDETDRIILSLLKQNADVSMEKLKEDLLLGYNIERTRQAVQARVARLKEDDVLKIKGIVDERKLGRPILAFVLVSFLPGSQAQRELARQLAEIPDTEGVWIISGDWDILLKVRGKSLEDIGTLIIEKIRSLEGVGKTVTCACFESVKEEY